MLMPSTCPARLAPPVGQARGCCDHAEERQQAREGPLVWRRDLWIVEGDTLWTQNAWPMATHIESKTMRPCRRPKRRWAPCCNASPTAEDDDHPAVQSVDGEYTPTRRVGARRHLQGARQ